MVADATVTVMIDKPGYDFPPGAGPPDERAMTADADGWYTLTWHKKQVTNARDVALIMPRLEQPGEMAYRISYFAPIALGFFFVVMIAVQVVRKLDLHPMHYLFLAGGFFAFHLLLSYLVDHLPLGGSFWIAAATSVLLVVMYLWLVAGARVAVLYAGLSQLVYLVLFSYTFFMENFTGLTVAVGSVLTLGVLMVLTSKVRWGEQVPELERKRRKGWVPVAPAPAPAAPPQGGAMPGFIGEKNGKDHGGPGRE
jgi:inner membrane protein involved in colicin E2 resistance